jgi:hypothetical protein
MFVRSVALEATEVPDDLAGLRLGFQDDGAMGVEELVGDIGEDECPARRGPARTMLGTQPGGAAKHRVPALRYTFEDVEEERQTNDRLKA